MMNTERDHVRVVPSKLNTRNKHVNATELEHQKEMFREARKAREMERLKRLRDMRLHNSSAATGFNTSSLPQSNSTTKYLPATATNRRNNVPKTASVSTESKLCAVATSSASSSTSQLKKLPVTSTISAQQADISKPKFKAIAAIAAAITNPASTTLRTASTASSSVSQPKKLPVPSSKPVQTGHIPSKTSGMDIKSKLSTGSSLSNRPSTKTRLGDSTKPQKLTTPRRAGQKRRSSGVPSSKVNSSRKKIRVQLSLPKPKAHTEHLSQQKLFVRQTKTSQLRLLRADPRLQYAKNLQNSVPHSLDESSLSNKMLQPSVSKKIVESNLRKSLEKSATDGKEVVDVMDIISDFAVDAVKFPKPSITPIKKTSFSYSTPQTPCGTPKPVVLRENLSYWLEKKGLSLDNFKHLRCFGVNGPLGVKRPQTPFGRVMQSTSKLRAIPEIAESTPNQSAELVSTPEAEDSVLNSTYTLEDENKENVDWSPSSDFLVNPHTTAEERTENIQNSSVFDDDCVKNHDKACGVLSELRQLIKEGYPSDQCELWVRAIRRRFPQCGDEAVYWECLASLEESRGDLHSAMECYKRAVLQGAEDTVQKLVEELEFKLADLNIHTVREKQEEISQTPRKRRSSCHLDPSNIIQSASIQFAVQEKVLSTQKGHINTTDDSGTLLIATPVRRSTRSTASPFHNLEARGLKCVRSLDVLEPDVRRSLIFHSNTALEPRE